MLHKDNEASRSLRGLIGLMVAGLAIGALAAVGAVQHKAKSAAAGAKPAGRAEITAVDVATGLVTARVRATKKTFQFKVKDTAALQSLKPGQSITVKKATGQVFQSSRLIGSTVTMSPRKQDTYGNAQKDCIAQHNASGLNCVTVVDQNITHPGESNPHGDDQVEYHCACY